MAEQDLQSQSIDEDALVKWAAELPMSDRLRAEAGRTFAATGLPGRRLEGWRWTDIRSAARKLGEPRGGKPKATVLRNPTGLEFAFGNNTHSAPPEHAGLRWRSEHLAEAVLPLDGIPMAALAAAGSWPKAQRLIEVLQSINEPVRLSFSSGEGRHWSHARVRITAGVEATVIETHANPDEISSVLVEYDVEDGATLNRVIWQDGSSGAVMAAAGTVRLGKGARLNQTTLAFGAKIARIETRVLHAAGGSEAILNGVYMVSAGKHADFTSHVQHAAPSCVTRQVVKGLARAGGKGVFQGKFLVERDGQKTDAQMQHNALLLEDGAEINAKPELEIYADDVTCNHGNTSGQMDAAALFYMRQRGIPEAEARAMLAESFVAETLSGAGEPWADQLMEEARAWLNAS